MRHAGIFAERIKELGGVPVDEFGDSNTLKLFEAIIDEEQEHLSSFENIVSHINELGNTYLARIAGTSASTGGFTKSFVNQQGGGG